MHTAKLSQLLTCNPSLSQIALETNVSSLPVSSRVYVATESPYLLIILTETTCNATLILEVVEYVRLAISTGAVVTVFTFACSPGPGPSLGFANVPSLSSIGLCNKE